LLRLFLVCSIFSTSYRYSFYLFGVYVTTLSAVKTEWKVDCRIMTFIGWGSMWSWSHCASVQVSSYRNL